MAVYTVITAQSEQIDIEAHSVRTDENRVEVTFLDSDGGTLASFRGYQSFYPKQAKVTQSESSDSDSV